MIPFTDGIVEQLLVNGRCRAATPEDEDSPVVKFFTPDALRLRDHAGSITAKWVICRYPRYASVV